MIHPLRVRDFMTTRLHTTEPDADIMSAVKILVDQNISGLLVVDNHGALKGILTERDCIGVALDAGYFDEAGGRVSNYMSSDIETVDVDLSLLDLAEQFVRRSFRRYPVTEDNKLVGVIARRDVLKALTSGAWFSIPGNTPRK